MTIYTLRHTFASRMIQNGMSHQEVSQLLGHTDIKTTMIYAHLEYKDVSEKARDVMNRLHTDSNSVEGGLTVADNGQKRTLTRNKKGD